MRVGMCRSRRREEAAAPRATVRANCLPLKKNHRIRPCCPMKYLCESGFGTCRTDDPRAVDGDLPHVKPAVVPRHRIVSIPDPVHRPAGERSWQPNR